MRRGELYRVKRPSTPDGDPKAYRAYVVVSRQVVIDSSYSSVICAPIYTHYGGHSTQIPVGINEGLKHDSSIHCDNLTSLPKTRLTQYLGKLDSIKLKQLNDALAVALALN
jgi:mRNA interferase MazF